MMNHHMPAGPGQSHMPMHQSRGRQQEFHPYHHPQQPPMHPVQYQGYHHPAPYYPHMSQYQPQRWHPHYAPQHFAPPPQMQQPFQPRSPMVVTSQPHLPMTPVTRQVAVPPAGQPAPMAQSPRPIPQHMQQQPTPASPPPPLASVEQRTEEVAVPSVPTPKRSSPSTVTVTQNPLSWAPELKEPYWPPLPWYSVPEDKAAFQRRAGQRLRKRKISENPPDAVALPKRKGSKQDATNPLQTLGEVASEGSTIAAPSEVETPATSHVPSENDFTQAPATANPAQTTTSSPKSGSVQQHVRRDTRTAIAVPNIPSLPKAREAREAVPKSAAVVPQGPESPSTDEPTPNAAAEGQTSEGIAAPQTQPKPAPKSWADLVKRNTNGVAPAVQKDGAASTNGAPLSKSASLADALRQYSVQNETTLSFLEPRGLVNTGNMCYMNSILQVLVFCVPFYSFLDQVRQRTVHSMKSDTPLLDAMIMVMREFKVLTSASSSDALRSALKQDQLELYGDPVTPEYVYDVIRKLPRFAGMRRGHQQDAEEFLGFLLEGLHDECVHVMQERAEEQIVENGVSSPTSVISPNSAEGWLEVGPKQKASVTRTAGQQDAPSPVTKIFGGHLRSELRVQGLKDSITLEPYKPLQLDIGAQHVNNIVDALKGLTRTESLTGDFGGRGNVAKKQVFIDTLPPVLVLHLKRFQYDNNLTGTQKIWKKVGYPLELEIPKEVFTPSKRGGLAVKGGPPRYRLISVVYHHGKSAAGGHYTADVLRQDSREWVRIDDTIIRRIRPEDVAEGGAEEDPKVLARALEQHRADQELQKQRNMYQGLDDDTEEERPWSEVNGGSNGQAKKWSGVAAAAPTNGTATPSSTTGKRTPTMRKDGIRDNKVAYILLYERIRD